MSEVELPLVEMLEPVSPWAPREEVGRYALLGKLAVGGMAEIWLARQLGPRGFQKVVVIKRITDAYSTDPEFVEMFLDEARIAAQLNHGNIVQIFDLGEHRGAWYIVMEYLVGEDLATVMQALAKSQRQASFTFTARVIADAAEGLAHAHEKRAPNGESLGVVHRDVSPQNLFVTYDGVVKVVDFGIARAASRGTKTGAGQVKGKFSYMAPEQAAGDDRVDGRADVFSLGVVLFEMLTFERLFKSKDQTAIIRELLRPEPFPPAYERRLAVPQALSDLTARALAKQPEARVQSARELATALRAWLATQPDSSGEPQRLMAELFAERMRERARLVDAASQGEITPSSQRQLKHDTGPSMPRLAAIEGTAAAAAPLPASPPSAPSAVAAPPRSRRVWWAAAVACVVLAGVGLALQGRGAQQEPVVPPPQVTPPPEVRVEPSRLAVRTTPPGAQLSLDGVVQGVTPFELNVQPGAHALQLTLAGYEPARRDLSVVAGQLQSLDLMLVAIKPIEIDVPSPRPTPVSQPRAPGRLTLKTSPWTHVMLGKKLLGDSPLIEVTLPAGRQKLRLINEEKRIDRLVEIEIISGQLTSKKLELQ